jgi:GT2 family glycosyltransferase
LDRGAAEGLLRERVRFRLNKEFDEADAIRERLRAGGWDVVDSADRSELQALKAPPSNELHTQRAVTLLTVVQGWKPDAERWLLSVFTHCKADFEAVIVDNSGDTRIAAWLESRAAERFRFIALDPPMGFASAVNAGIDAAAGDVVVLFDPSIELTGDAVTPLIDALADPAVAVAGPYGLRGQGTLKEFERSAGPEVDAIEGYCMAFRRADAQALEGFDPNFRFYRIADIEFSFRLRDRGGKAIALPDLPLEKHDHQVWEATDPKERNRLSKRNMYRFLDRWGERADLLVPK